MENFILSNSQISFLNPTKKQMYNTFAAGRF